MTDKKKEMIKDSLLIAISVASAYKSEDKGLYSDAYNCIVAFEAENAELREKLDKAQKRVAVLEHAIRIYQTQYGDVRFFNFDVAIRQAEKEIGNDLS